jgi:hypothetical protein
MPDVQARRFMSAEQLQGLYQQALQQAEGNLRNARINVTLAEAALVALEAEFTQALGMAPALPGNGGAPDRKE